MSSTYKRSNAAAPRRVRVVAARYRCAACGNLTRFDVTATRRTRAFHHYSLGGELTVEEEQVLDEVVEQVSCRWCGSSANVEAIAESRAPGSGN
jgi:DNA-directed RNA polymerase subunit RPC12/RpoP